MLETPSRILRRIEALEAQDSDLPSLPSFPAFDDSGARSIHHSSAQSLLPKDLQIGDGEEDIDPYHSTPVPVFSHTTRSTMRLPNSASSSATRFANSMRTSVSIAKKNQEDSFEVSEILPVLHQGESSYSASIPDAHLPPLDQQVQADPELSSPNVSKSVVRSASPLPVEQHHTPGSKIYDYSISLRSEPKVSICYFHSDYDAHI